MAALALALLLHSADAQADLFASRDVDRVLVQLEDSTSPPHRAGAARWLMRHGPHALVMPRLLDALERETSPEVLGPLTHAVARLLGPEHDARLIRIAPTIRSPFRGVLVVAIAQLGTEASDAFLAQELAALGAVSIEVAQPTLALGTSPASERVSLIELAEARRDAVVPLLLREAHPPRMAPTEALVQLAHEDARSLFVSLLDDPALSPLAWEGLAALRPDAATADTLRARLTTVPSPAMARALYAADPNAEELALWLHSGPSEVQQALRALLIAHDPARLTQEDVLTHAEDDARAWAASFASPNPAAHAAYVLLMTSDAVPIATRQAASDAHLVLAEGDRSLCTASAAQLEGTHAVITAARQARICRTPFTVPASLSNGAALYLRALAGEDMRGALAAAWREESVDADTRIDLAHAYWVSREADAGLADAWATEPNDEVRDVLSLAVQRHRMAVSASLLASRLEAPRTRFSSLLVASAQTSLHPLTRPHILAALHDPSPRIRAAALLALSHFEDPSSLAPWACAALEGAEEERAAALAVLPSDARCVHALARVDASLRRPQTRTEPHEAIVLVEGDARPRLLFTGMDGSLGMAQPTSLGVVIFPDVRAVMRVVPALF